MKPTIETVWAQARKNHEIYSKQPSWQDNVNFLTLGLTGEAGEISNFVKKQVRDKIDYRADLRLEVADVCAYAFMLADQLGMTADDLLATIAKKQQVFIDKMHALESNPRTIPEPQISDGQ